MRKAELLSEACEYAVACDEQARVHRLACLRDSHARLNAATGQPVVLREKGDTGGPRPKGSWVPGPNLFD